MLWHRAGPVAAVVSSFLLGLCFWIFPGVSSPSLFSSGSVVNAMPLGEVSATATPVAEMGMSIIGGRFYTETNSGAGSDKGYSVTGVMWSVYDEYGRETVWGPPVSRPFIDEVGRTCQAFQRGIFQVTIRDGRVANVEWFNVFDQLSSLGRDQELEAYRQVPKSFDFFSDNGATWTQVVNRHLAILDLNTEIKLEFMSNSRWLEMYGLPMAGANMGNNYTIRCQRAVFQQWKQDLPWASKGQVTIGLGGDIFKELGGLVPGVVVLETKRGDSAVGATPSIVIRPTGTLTPAVSATPTMGASSASSVVSSGSSESNPTSTPTAPSTTQPGATGTVSVTSTTAASPTNTTIATPTTEPTNTATPEPSPTGTPTTGT